MGINAQSGPSLSLDSARFLIEAKSFLLEVKGKELKDSNFRLVDAPKFSCLEYTLDDSVSFSNDELKDLSVQVNAPLITNWAKVFPSGIKLLPADFVNAKTKVIKNPKRETKRFNRLFSGSYRQFSPPLFLRDYSFCMIYVDEIAPAGRSKGELQVFEKVNGIWKQLPSRCEWSE